MNANANGTGKGKSSRREGKWVNGHLISLYTYYDMRAQPMSISYYTNFLVLGADNNRMWLCISDANPHSNAHRHNLIPWMVPSSGSSNGHHETESRKTQRIGWRAQLLGQGSMCFSQLYQDTLRESNSSTLPPVKEKAVPVYNCRNIYKLDSSANQPDNLYTHVKVKART